MDQANPSTTPHLRVQLTLLSTSRSAPGPRSGRFGSNVRVASRNFAAEFAPVEPLVPGGHAVHCSVVLDQPSEALPHLPAGAMFELWENGRCGYGMVLNVLAR